MWWTAGRDGQSAKALDIRYISGFGGWTEEGASEKTMESDKLVEDEDDGDAEAEQGLRKEKEATKEEGESDVRMAAHLRRFGRSPNERTPDLPPRY